MHYICQYVLKYKLYKIGILKRLMGNSFPCQLEYRMALCHHLDWNLDRYRLQHPEAYQSLWFLKSLSSGSQLFSTTGSGDGSDHRVSL